MTVREPELGVTPEALEPRAAGPAATAPTLVEAALAGDRAAFGFIVQRRTGPAMRLAMGILGDEADARDAVQDAFVLAWRRLGQLREADRFDAWLDRIVVNRCRELRRNRGRTRVREIRMEPWALDDREVAEPFAGPEESIASIDAIERAFEHLGIEERAILLLHHLEHRPLPVIAASLAIPVGTVKSRLFSARRALERGAGGRAAMNARPMLTDRALETMLARRAGRARLGDLPEVIVMAVSTEPVPHRPMLRWPRWVGRPHRLAHPAIVAALLVLGAVAAAAAVGAWLLLREAPPKYPLQPTGLQAMATTWQPVAIVPDAGGGYWVERVGGLVRFGADGRPAGEWSAADDRALAFGDSHTAAMGIAADSHGGVWTWQGPTIRQFDGRGFTELVDAGAQVSGLAEAVDGSLWIATIEGQVLAWDGTSLATRWSRAADGGAIGYPSTATVFAIAAAPTGDVWGIFGSRDGPTATGWYDGHAWRYFGRESGLDLLQEPELAFAPDGTPWLLNGSPYDAEARELLAFDGARWTRRVMSPAGASSLAIGAGGVPWVIEGGWTSGGVWRLDGERWRGLDPRADLPEAEDALALAASGGDILVVTDRGTGRIRDGRMTAVWSASGSGVAGRVLAGGDPGPVWVSDGRVARPYADGAWGDELPLPGDGGLTVDRAGRLWAWGGAGLAVRDGGAWRTVAMGSPDRVAIGPDGSAWVLRTTYDELGNPVRPPTLRRFVPSGSSWQVAEAITLEAAPSLYTIDPDGRLLFLSESAASRLSMRLRVDGAWVNLPAVDDGGTPVPMDAVVDAAFAPSGDLWVLGGTWTSVGWNWGPPDNMRLGVLHDGAWTVFSCGEGGARAAVGACGTAIDPVSEPGHLAFGEDGSVWLAGDGLARFDGAEWTWVAKGVSLSNPVVAGDGSVWAAGAGTAFRWVPGS